MKKIKENCVFEEDLRLVQTPIEYKEELLKHMSKVFAFQKLRKIEVRGKYENRI